MYHQEQNRQERRGLIYAIGATILVLLSLVLALSFVNRAGAQAMEPPTPPTTGSGFAPGGITVIGRGTISLEPDIARANIGVEAVNESVREASDQAEATMRELLDALTAQGIAENDIQTSGYSIYSERGMGSQPDDMRYRVSNQVQVTIRDLDQVGQVLDSAIDAGANQIYGVQFDLDDPSSFEGEARSRAIADARSRAEELAQLSGVGVGPVLYISEILGQSGIPMMSMEMMAADGMGGGTSIRPGEYELTLQVQVTYALAHNEAGSVLPTAPETDADAADADVDVDVDAEETGQAVPPVEESAEIPAADEIAPSSPGSMVSAASSFYMPGSMGLATVSVTGGDEEQLRSYIEKTLQPFYPGSGISAISVTIGDLPADLPLALELPAEISVIGATERSGDFEMTEIILSAASPAEEWLELIYTDLTDQGFVEPSALTGHDPQGVFQSSPPLQERMLCSPERDFAVSLLGAEREDEAMIRIMLNPMGRHAGNICDPDLQATPGPSMYGLPQGLLPTLTAPQGTNIYGTGMSSGDRTFEVSAQIITAQESPESLFDGWVSVLEDQGWSLLSEERGDAVVWSLWEREFEGDTWQSVFYILRNNIDEERLQAAFHIERIN